MADSVVEVETGAGTADLVPAEDAAGETVTWSTDCSPTTEEAAPGEGAASEAEVEVEATPLVSEEETIVAVATEAGGEGGEEMMAEFS